MKLADIKPGNWYRIGSPATWKSDHIIWITGDAKIDKVNIPGQWAYDQPRRSPHGRNMMTWPTTTPSPRNYPDAAFKPVSQDDDDIFDVDMWAIRRMLSLPSPSDKMVRKLSKGTRDEPTHDGYFIDSRNVLELIGSDDDLIAWVQAKADEATEARAERIADSTAKAERDAANKAAKERLPLALVAAVNDDLRSPADWMEIERMWNDR